MARENYILVRICKFVRITINFSIFFLTFCSTIYAAGWEQIATGSNFKEYFKDGHRTGRTASIIAMRDYASEMKQGDITYLSVKKLYQFDCSRAKFRLTLVEKYEDNMLGGELSWASKTKTSWENVNPNTLNEVAMKKACKKK